MGDPILHIVRGHHVIQGIHLLMKIAHVHLTVIDHLVRAPKLERRELHRHIVENDGGLLLYPITDLLYGSLDNLFMIEWQARKIVDRHQRIESDLSAGHVFLLFLHKAR